MRKKAGRHLLLGLDVELENIKYYVSSSLRIKRLLAHQIIQRHVDYRSKNKRLYRECLGKSGKTRLKTKNHRRLKKKGYLNGNFNEKDRRMHESINKIKLIILVRK